MCVGVKVALSAAISRSAFHPIKPGRQVRILLSQRVAFVIIQTGVHAFDIRREDDISRTELFQEVWTRSRGESQLNLIYDFDKLLSVALLLLKRHHWIAKPGTPSSK